MGAAANETLVVRYRRVAGVAGSAGEEISDPTQWFKALATDEAAYNNMMIFYGHCSAEQRQEIHNSLECPSGSCFQSMDQMRAHLANFDGDDFTEWKQSLEQKFPNNF